MGLVLALPSAVAADQFVGVTINESGLCVGVAHEVNVTGTFRRSDTGPQYPDGATLTITGGSAAIAGATVAVTSITDATAILPADWTSQSFPFTASDTVSMTVSVTPTAPGEAFGTFTWFVSVNGVPFSPQFGPILLEDSVDCDADNDGVADADDVCPGTVLPQSSPPQWKKNHYKANVAGHFVDVTSTDSGITVADTGGCSGTQIIAAAGLGKGHTKNGISGDALAAWVASQ
jgi:carbon monoxide dehydrogenase subunit G